jgi:hypothetical protein
VDGKSVELHIYEKSRGFRVHAIGRMWVQYHPVTSGLFCIWVAYDHSGEEVEMAMDDIDEHHLRLHPGERSGASNTFTARINSKPARYRWTANAEQAF